MQGALTEFQGANGGVLPVSANNALASFVSYLNSQRHYARAEKILIDQLKHPVHGQQRLWLVQNLYERLSAKPCRTTAKSRWARARRSTRRTNALCSKTSGPPTRTIATTWSTSCAACTRRPTARTCRASATTSSPSLPKSFPDVLKRQTSNYPSLVNTVAYALHDVAGVRAGLAFLIERIENEPGWFKLQQPGWLEPVLRDAGQLAVRDEEPGRSRSPLPEDRARPNCGATSKAGSRATASSTTGTKTTGSGRRKSTTSRKSPKKSTPHRKQSGAQVQYIADYLFQGLRRKDRAIEMLFIAHRDKVLDEGGQSKLVDFLHQEKRYGESIALLEPLIAEHPDNLNYRVWLMHAYFRTNRKAELLALLKQTDEYFHKDTPLGRTSARGARRAVACRTSSSSSASSTTKN